MEDLKTYLMNLLDRTQKQTLCVMPKLDYKPKDLEEMADCEFYIINGQYSVPASKMDDRRQCPRGDSERFPHVELLHRLDGRR